jgi:hypothetical protein
MAVLLIDNSFNLKINLGLIWELTGINDCHCFTDYPAAAEFLAQNSSKVQVVFVNPNLNDEQFPSLMERLKKVVFEKAIKVRVLYRSAKDNTLLKHENMVFTGMPITRTEIDLLKTIRKAA